MCGIAGALLLETGARQADLPRQAVRRMCERMERRGPDALGFWDDERAGLSLGHRRLAIVDLDPRSDQPMLSSDGRYAIVYNGEIYNFRALRGELEAAGQALRTQSDTEVILALFAMEGAKMLPRLRGMFTFAIWDSAKQELFVARDPYGIKPLYIAATPGAVLFASQVKGLLASGLVSREPDPLGQASFWLLGSVMEPNTWFRGISALPAGHYAVINRRGVETPRRWWDIGECWREAPDAGAMPHIMETVRNALKGSVEAHLVADVPVGVFLSGGIDSSSMAALMRETESRDVRGITLTYPEFAGKPEDELPMAAAVARKYGITHHERSVTFEEFRDDLPRILRAMDQPSIDGINTWYASKAIAEQGLKVVVSGVGGDELFQGYSSFRELPRLVAAWRGVGGFPGAAALARGASEWQARRSGNARWRLAPRALRSIEGAWFLRRGLFSPEELPLLMGDLAAALPQLDPEALVTTMTGPVSADSRLALGQIESMTYLRNQLLRDSDWASMDHSVELRTPLVDAWLLRELKPLLSAFRRFPQKRLLAEAPASPLPEELIGRRKTGFGIPVRQWLARMGRGHSEAGMSRGWAREVAQETYGRD